MKYPSWLPILLGFLTAIGPLSTDMYLPAFPAIEQALGLQIGSVQLTLATWFLGLAVGQITQGTLSDRFGRRGPLLFGILLYTVSNAGCALAPDLTTLSILRFFSAIGGSASMVIPRAVVRDLSEGIAAARMMSKLILVMGAAPILAPSLGSLVLGLFGWHAIFWICSIYGGVCGVLVWFFLPETLPRDKQVRLGVASTITRYGEIISEKTFLTNALMGGFGSFGMFAFISGSPGILIDTFHISPTLYAVVFSSCAFNFIVFSQVNPRILPRFGADRVLRAAVRTFWCASATLVVIAFLQLPVWWVLIPPIMLCMGCQGFNQPNSTVGALQRHAAHAGMASALMGTMQFVMGGVAALLVGVLSDGTARGLSLVMLTGATGAVTADIFRRNVLRKRGG